MLKFNSTKKDIRKMDRHAAFPDELNGNIERLNAMVQDARRLDAQAKDERGILDTVDSGNVDADQIRESMANARKAEFESLVTQLHAYEFYRENIAEQLDTARHAERARRLKAANALRDEKAEALMAAGIEDRFEAADRAGRHSEVVRAKLDAENAFRGEVPQPGDEEVAEIKRAIREAAERL